MVVNDLYRVAEFYNFILHEAYIQGKLDHNIQFNIDNNGTIYVEKGIFGGTRKKKLEDLLEVGSNGEAFRSFVFREQEKMKSST